ncbi:MAG TPA: phospholipase C, phosphocholine-specific [Gryllotalpicola sp.]
MSETEEDPDISRRGFIGAAAAITGAAVVGTASAADAATPFGPGHGHGPQPHPAPGTSSHPHGDLRDIKHVIVVMQENRSFDHYFGTMKGVRGFGDRSTIKLPGGGTVWRQPQAPVDGAPTQYPWPLSGTDMYSGETPPDAELGAANYGGTSHSWTDQHGAWYGGLMNGWYYAKGGPTTLGYLTRADLPFHFALAEAYTVGDAYHCSVMSATGPNRTFLWSGTINADQKHPSYVPSISTNGGPYIAYDGGDERGDFLTWESYPETLQKAGVSWHIYQCADDYGDTGAEYFATMATMDPTQTDPKTGKPGVPDPKNPLYVHGVANVPTDTGVQTANAADINAAIKADVLSGKLAQVSWVVNNQFFSEHPVTSPHNGANFLKGLLEALNSDPEVFNSTVVIVNYDENDGQFDHVPPPVPAPGEADEFVSGTLGAYGVVNPLPVGLGFRVPLLLVSPWTRGGWVTSEVSDHSSVIQLLEKWTTALGRPAISPNVSSWRRRVSGDLLGAFDFTAPIYGLPKLPDPGPLVTEHRYNPIPDPKINNVMPTQEPGTKRARPLPYQPNANISGFSHDGRAVQLQLSNNAPFANKAAHFAVYNNLASIPGLAEYPSAFPGQYTVDASSTRWNRTVPGSAPTVGTAYDITVTGPNRFLREFAGDLATAGKTAEATVDYWKSGFDPEPKLLLRLANTGRETATFIVTHNAYTHAKPKTVKVGSHGSHTESVNVLTTASGWYDVTVTLSSDRSWSRRFVGHIENGKPSITGSAA